MKRLTVLTIAMVSGMLAMAIDAPQDVRWEEEDLTFYWENDSLAEYSTYTLDGVTRGFFYYHSTSYSPDPQLLSPGEHTFCVYCADANMNCSAWSCITIYIEDSISIDIPDGPAMPQNLYCTTNGNEVTLHWTPGDEVMNFNVFLEDRVVCYNWTSTSYTFIGLAPGIHQLGVCAWDVNGYVSEIATILIEHNMQNQPSVLLAEAYWPFEDPFDMVTGQQLIYDSEKAEYAYRGNSAAVLQGESGDVPYIVLPAISDVQNYDSLELRFMARGGYWSTLGEIWGKIADEHRLQVGSLPYIPRQKDFLQLVSPLCDTIVPYANIGNFENHDADSMLFWREIRLPLRGADRYIAIYAECARNNYVVIDDVRICRIETAIDSGQGNDGEGPDDGENTDGETGNGLDVPEVEAVKQIGPDGRLLIRKGGRAYDLLGRQIR